MRYDTGRPRAIIRFRISQPIRPHRRHFLSESSVYRILKAEDLITSPAYVVRQVGTVKLALVQDATPDTA